MEVYRSEEEQFEALKKWWKENARSAILGIVIGVSVIGGWGAWQNNQATKAIEASDLFQELQKAVREKRNESALKLGERLNERYPGFPYSIYANFFVAKIKTEIGDLQAAKEALRKILASDTEESLKHIARLRLTRVMAADGEFEAGLNMIAAADIARSGDLEGYYEELRGDLYVALHKDVEARISYDRAKELGQQSPFLELKRNDLEALNVPELAD